LGKKRGYPYSGVEKTKDKKGGGGSKYVQTAYFEKKERKTDPGLTSFGLAREVVGST